MKIPAAAHRRRPFVPLALAAIAGILTAEHSGVDFFFLPLFGAAAIATAVFRKTLLTSLTVALGFAVLHSTQLHHSDGVELARQLDALPSSLVTVEGVVADAPVAGTRGTRPPRPAARFTLRAATIEHSGVRSPSRGRILVRWAGDPPGYGDRVSVTGAVSEFDAPTNPAEFDAAAYYARQDIFRQLQVRHSADATILERGTGNPILAMAIRSRAWIAETLAVATGPDPYAVGIIQGMLLGERSEQPETMKETFHATGTLHLFAVSGLHVGMIALAFWLVLGPFCKSRRQAILILIPLLFVYALITGLRPSVLRATIMTTIVLCGFLAERRPPLINNLSAAAFFLLAINTQQLFMTGFLLSFCVVFAILLFANLFARLFEDIGVPDPFIPAKLLSWPARKWQKCGRFLASLAGVSIAAWLGSIFVTLLEFHLFTPVAVIANMVVVPVAFSVVGLGLLTIASAPLSGAVAALFGNANWLVTHCILYVLGMFAAIPGGHFYVAPASFPDRNSPALHVLDLGRGGAMVFSAGGAHWLIDSGSSNDFGFIVGPTLHSLGINRLQGIILTHGDASHTGGAVDAIRKFRPRVVVDSGLSNRSPARRAALAEAEAHGIPVRIAAAGDTLDLPGGAVLHVLYPPPGLQRRTADDQALVLRLEAQGKRILLTGDAGFFTEMWMLRHDRHALAADVLIMGRHAADHSGMPEFVEAVNPHTVIATHADFPRVQQVPDAFAADLESRNIRLHRLDQGAITIRFRNGQLHIQ